MTKIAVNPKIIQWAIQRSSRTLSELKGTFPKIENWLSSHSQPTLRQLESFAGATRTPLGFFFLNEPPLDQLPVPYFRTLDNGNLGANPFTEPSPDLLDTVYAMQRRQDWMREHLIEEGHEPLSYVGTTRMSERPAIVAQRMRQALGLTVNWASQQPNWTEALDTLREAMESAGILVVANGVVANNNHRKLDPDEFRGFVLVDMYAPLVFINGSDGRAARMFTLAHELAHVFIGRSAVFNLRAMQPAENEIEQVCNQMGAEFLVPERALRFLWSDFKSLPDPFEAIARHFKVSILVATRRALELNLITKTVFFDFYNQYLQNVHKETAKTGGGDFYNNQNMRVGRRFYSSVVRATREGKLPYTEAYRLTGLYGKTFDNYAVHLGLGALV